MATMKSLIWALVLLFMIFYVFGIIFTQAVSDYLIEHGGSLHDAAHGEVLFRFWGSLPRSMFTLFKAIAGGLSWDDCVFPLHAVGGFSVAAFIGYVAFTYFAVLNVVTGIFCQSAIDTAQSNEELLLQTLMVHRESFVKKMAKLFETFDTDNSGTISRWEFEQHMEEPAIQAIFEALQVDSNDACLLFTLLSLDSDEGTQLDFDEFVGGLMRMKGSAKRADFLMLETKLLGRQNAIDKGQRELRREVALLRQSSLDAWKACGGLKRGRDGVELTTL